MLRNRSTTRQQSFMLHLGRVVVVIVGLLQEPCWGDPGAFNIPGTTQTNDGYDTELGTNAICWFSHGPGPADLEKSDSEIIPFPNPLIADFVIGGNGVQPLKNCPVGNIVRARAPVEFERDGKLRVENYYEFTVFVQLNATSLIGHASAISDPTFVSDDEPKVAIQIMACDVENAGFCTPFKHEESNLRSAALNITEQVGEGDLHGNTHVHSGYNFVVLPASDGPIYEFQLPIHMRVNEPGKYFHIAAVQLFFRDYFRIESRYDIANAMPLHQRLITYQAQTVVLVVPTPIRYLSYAAILVTCSILIYLLFHTVHNRNHQVLKLTQGGFLILFLCAALTLSACCFLLEPRENPIYCRAGTPILLIAAQLLYAVTLGRLWRINAVSTWMILVFCFCSPLHFTVSPLLAKTLRQKERQTFFSWLKSFVVRPSEKDTKSKMLRKQVKGGQLALRIVFYTVPQVLIQVCLCIFAPMRYTVYLNEDESVGSAQCSSGQRGWLTSNAAGYVCFASLMLFLLVTAHQTRCLPSLFNETRVIFDSTLATLVIVLLGAGIMAVSNGPTTSPAVSYLLGITLTLSSTLNTSLRIIVPKLRMIWRGETVLVSKLVSDHKQAVLKDDMMYKHSRRGSATEHAVHGANFGNEEQSIMFNASTSSTGGLEFEDVLGAPASETSIPHVVIHEEETPAKFLVLKLVDLEGKLSRLNNKIMSGAVVPSEEWESLRKTSHHLSSTFRRKVCFAWEVESDGGICFSEDAARSLNISSNDGAGRESSRFSSALLSEESFIAPTHAITGEETERAGNSRYEDDEECHIVEVPTREVRFQIP